LNLKLDEQTFYYWAWAWQLKIQIIFKLSSFIEKEAWNE